MQQSEQINELAAALSKAQGEIDGAKKDSVNPFYKAAYSDLASVIAAAKTALTKYGLSYTQVTDFNDNCTWLETKLMHSSGQYLSGRYLLTFPDNKPQTHGSVITYAKRYALQAILGIASADDDANAAQAATAGKPTPVPKSSTATATGTTKKATTSVSTAASQAFRDSPLPVGVFDDSTLLITKIQKLVGTKHIPIPRVTEIIEMNWAPAKMLKDLDAKQLTKLHDTLAVM